MASWSDLIGGWWLYPGRPERRVVEHHLDVVAHPDVFGLTRDDIERIGRTDRVGLLLAAMHNGWIRVRVYRGDPALAVHAEVWELDAERRGRIRAWSAARSLPGDHAIVLGALAREDRSLIHLSDLANHRPPTSKR